MASTRAKMPEQRGTEISEHNGPRTRRLAAAVFIGTMMMLICFGILPSAQAPGTTIGNAHAATVTVGARASIPTVLGLGVRIIDTGRQDATVRSRADLSTWETYGTATYSTSPPSSGCPVAPTGQTGTWVTLFCDGFDGSSVDTTKWQTNWLGAPGAITKPINSAEQNCYDPAQATEAGGELDLTAIAGPCTVNGVTYPYRSGIVESFGHFDFTYGYAEARLWTPDGGCDNGVWPQWWMDGEGTWPSTGEFDALEAYGCDSRSTGHYHYLVTGRDANIGFQTTVGGASTGWHTYAVRWSPSNVTWYYDGVQVFQTATATSSPIYLIFNLGTNSTSTPVPATLRVDYAVVYSGQAVVYPPCTAVNASWSALSPASSGTAVSITGTATGCPNPRYQFWLLAPGSGTWKNVQPYGSSNGNIFNWNTSDLPAGTYSFAVWVKDLNSAGTYGNSLGRWDTSANTTYSLSVTRCTAASVTSSPNGTTTAGAAVTFTAGATGCQFPLYQVWMLAPGSSTWKNVQAYGNASDNIFTWTTIGKAKGAYRFSVWARGSGSPGNYVDSLGQWDTSFNLTYTLT